MLRVDYPSIAVGMVHFGKANSVADERSLRTSPRESWGLCEPRESNLQSLSAHRIGPKIGRAMLLTLLRAGQSFASIVQVVSLGYPK